MSKGAGYVSADYLRKAADMTKILKQRSYALMNIKPDSQLLDVGCGPGIDTVALAKLINDAGHVYGVDIDEEMLAEADTLAREENLQGRISYQLAEVTSLPFSAGQMDACRAERLFQVLPPSIDKDQALDEILRVLKPGGRIVLADTDWATASVNFDDAVFERKLVNFFAQSMRPNGFAGRQFFRMLKQRALKNIDIEIFPMTIFDYELTPFGDWLCDEAVQKAVASPDEMANWKATLTEHHDKEEFYCTVNMVVVSAENI